MRRLLFLKPSTRDDGVPPSSKGKESLSAFGTLALLLLLSLPTQAAVFHPDTFTLANGLQVVVVPNRLSPAVAQMVWYRVGAADEEAGHSGLAHYLEHLMFRGTPDVPAGTFSPLIAAQGGRDNAFTSYDFTAYHAIVAADRLAMIMQLEADRMQNLRITTETATPELSVVLNERDERTDNNPQGKFAEKIRHALFPDHVYGRPVIGWRPEIAKASVADAENFYARHYAPNNAVVVISGNVETAEVMRLAAATFGRVPAREVPVRRALPQPPQPTEHRVVMTDAGVQQPHLEWHVVAPPRSYALEVLTEALGGEVGALYRDLVLKQGIASGVDVDYDAQARGPTSFTIVATPQQDTKALEAALHKSLRRLARRGLGEQAVREAKERLCRSAVFARDSLLAPGYVFGMALTTGQDVADVEAWPARIKAVTTAQVNAALRDLVASKRQVTGILLPDPNATPEQRAKARAAGQGHEVGVR